MLVGVSCGGVWRTSDRGATWACTRLRGGGAPARSGDRVVRARDLVYRHALDVTEGEGNRAALAFGSTTGNLWFSEDEGDRFVYFGVSSVTSHSRPPGWT